MLLKQKKLLKLTKNLKLDRFLIFRDRKSSSFQLQVERLGGESKHAQRKFDVAAVVGAVEGEVLEQRRHQRERDVLNHLVAHARPATHRVGLKENIAAVKENCKKRQPR